MTSVRNHIIQYKSISWAVAAVFLLLTILPAHYHMHHGHHDHHALHKDSVEHGHTVDFHTAFEKVDPVHSDENLQTLAGSPDGIIKKVDTITPTFALLAILLLILPIPTYRIFIRRNSNVISPRRSDLHFSPPLRAPPSH